MVIADDSGSASAALSLSHIGLQLSVPDVDLQDQTRFSLLCGEQRLSSGGETSRDNTCAHRLQLHKEPSLKRQSFPQLFTQHTYSILSKYINNHNKCHLILILYCKYELFLTTTAAAATLK